MKKSISTLLGLLISMSIWGQQPANMTDLPSLFTPTITAEDLHAHISFLADDLLEGRETGERGQKMAAHYIKTHFMRIGLLPGNPNTGTYYQSYFLNSSKINDAAAKIGKNEYEFKKDFIASSGQLPDELSGKLVYAGYGIQSEDYNNLEGVDLKGKIAVIFSGAPQPSEESLFKQIQTWKNRNEALIDNGAEAVLMVMPDSVYKVVARFARRRSTSIDATPKPGKTSVYVSESMGNDLFKAAKKKPMKLKEQLANNAKVPSINFKKANFSLQASVERTSKSAENVIGIIEGTDKKDELLVITGHYDHIGITNGEINNGADDDGSGTSAVLELAEAFAEAAAAGHRPRRSIAFMTVSGEEKGLLGSAFYTDNPLYPLASTVANLNIDMIGRIDDKYKGTADSANYVYVIGSDRLSTDLHKINEAANDAQTQIILDYQFNAENDPQRFYYRSDHYNFAKNNIPVIFYFTGVHEDYHRPTDDIEKINYPKAAKITQLVFSTAWELVNREDRIVVDKAGE